MDDRRRTTAEADTDTYRSAFRAWDTRAWIRAKPHRTTVPFDADRLFFTPEVVPLIQLQPLADGVVADLCIRHLQAHLAMTVRLELGPVNDACMVIRDSGYSQWLPAALRHDALRLYADEAGHAEMTAEMALAVEEATGISPPAHTPPYVRTVAALLAAVPAGDTARRDLVRFLAGVVSETLISATLAHVPHDDRVQPVVRQLIADHAEDERRHAALFRDALAAVWPRLTPDERHAATTAIVPELLLAFLRPDRDELHAAAAAHPEVFDDPAAAADATIAGVTAARLANAAAQPTLRAFRDAATTVPLTVSA